MVDNTPITISEALHYLEESRLRIVGRKGGSKNNFFDSILDYCQNNSKGNSLHSIQNLTESLKNLGLNDLEIVQVCNLIPQSIDEIKILVPSLERLDENILEKVLDKINTIQDI